MCELHFGYFVVFLVIFFAVGCCVNTYNQVLIVYAFCAVSYLVVVC